MSHTHTQLIIANGSLFAPFIAVDPTFGIVVSVLVVSGVLIYIYYQPLTASLGSLEQKVTLSSGDRYKDRKRAKNNLLDEWIKHSETVQL
jgi:hypothetical protein